MLKQPPYSSDQMHILCFNPYVRWTLHSARQNTILHGLHLRNARTQMVLCDGLMPECDLYQPSKGPKAERTAKSCNRCQAESAFLTAKSSLSFLWLGRWTEPDTIAKAHEWAADVNHPETAQYNGWPIGEWVRSSVQSHFRRETLDLEEPETLALYRRYIAGGVIIASALDSLYRHEQPDALLLFNGRMAPTRIALELAKQHSIRTITEERGFTPGHMRLVENTHCLDPQPFYALCQAWKDTPLNQEEMGSLRDLLEKHLSGSGHEMSHFAAPTSGSGSVREHLSIDRDKRLAVLYTSSTDEPHGQPEATGCFDHQRDWVHATIESFRSKPDWHLVVRTHPNTGGKRSVGTNQDEMRFVESLTQAHPDNVSIILPAGDVSSFDLMQEADCGLVWHSSIGLEMAALGRPVLRAGRYWFRDADFMRAPNDSISFTDEVDRLLQESSAPPSIDHSVAAWRFAFCWFFRQSIDFPLVRQPDWASGEAAYDSLDELGPGKDSALDKVCSIIMDGAPVHPDAGD
ncbi:MAG: hypothetical protein HOH20_05750, partial [Rhodospirillaceae bacterium]|nr:hypothetical protein [Rhodospirillaceae bacterium]